MTNRVLQTASLSWHDSGTPASGQFNDVYFSKDDGCAESHYVFVQHNQLPQRFAALDKSHFTIAETGFGTGLNFLNTWQLWRQQRKPGQKLYFISAELYPVSKNDLTQCLQQWPQFAELSAQLLDNYPLPVRGMHCLELSDGVTLILLLDDVLAGFSQLLENLHPNLAYDPVRAVDAWFLDGFAPAQNQAMWQDDLFRLMGQLSHRGSTLATFTAAGFVRRGLQAAGFAMQKVKGYGRKRDMLTGTFYGLPQATQDTEKRPNKNPYGAFWPVYRDAPARQSVIVIGAGIAGCTTAWQLANAGMDVTLLDSEATPMQQASGNPQAVLFPKLSADSSAFAEFNLHSLLYAWRFYRQAPFRPAFHPCGLLDLIPHGHKKNQAVLLQLHTLPDLLQACPAEHASQLTNTQIKQNGVFYPQSGWLDTQQLAQQFAAVTHYRFIGNSPVERLQKTENGWVVYSGNNRYNAHAVVLCNAQAAGQLLPDFQTANPTQTLPTHNIRGQITSFLQDGLPTINTVICHEGYLCPPVKQQYHCGATFDLKDDNPAVSTSSQQHNLHTLAQHLPDFSAIPAASINRNRVNFRCCAPDYLPLTGPLPDTDAFSTAYRDYRHNAKAMIPLPGSYHPGLFINIGYGSRGFSSAPLGAAIIRAYLLRQAYPTPFTVIAALNPARFLIRSLSSYTASPAQ